jgi:riboflavin synthase
MFSGIVETVGNVVSVQQLDDCQQLVIAPQLIFDDLHIGDSVAINGVCLTVTEFTPHAFSVTVVPETLRLTNLAQLQPGQLVNLERSLKYNARIGGHYVQGHVDAMGKIADITSDGQGALLVTIIVPKPLTKYVVNKGYIGLDGMSITVIEASEDYFTVTFIPHTAATTIVKNYQKGSAVNIEVDIIGKYFEKMLGSSQ